MNVMVIATFVFLLFAGCTPVVQNATFPRHPMVQAASIAEKEYHIQVGDQLDIKFFYNQDLNESVVVRPDGRISLQLIQELRVIDLTPAQLREALVNKYREQLLLPELAVIVRSFSAQKIYVDGEVGKPGMVPLIGAMTVLQSISQAGGFKDTARLNEVIIIRRGTANKHLTIPVNLNQAIDGTDISQDIMLRPFDIVYVPRSVIANVNVWVDQYIRRNIPIGANAGVYYNGNQGQ